MDNEKQYEKEGQMMGSVGAVVYLIVGIGVSIMILIFVGVLAGQTYQVAEADINAITNTTIRGHINAAVIEAFSALETTGSYLPLIVLAFVITLVLALILGMLGTVTGGGGAGGAVL